MKKIQPTFYFVGNNLAIDFVNTQVKNGESLIELFNEYDDILLWASQAGITLESTPSSFDMNKIYHFRSQLSSLITSFMQEEALDPKCISELNRYLAYAPLQQQLNCNNGILSSSPLHQQLSLVMLLGKIAHELTLLLVSEKKVSIKKCSNTKCVLIFVDTSRTKKRRWCNMDLCGNRAKATTFYHTTKKALL